MGAIRITGDDYDIFVDLYPEINGLHIRTKDGEGVFLSANGISGLIRALCAIYESRIYEGSEGQEGTTENSGEGSSGSSERHERPDIPPGEVR